MGYSGHRHESAPLRGDAQLEPWAVGRSPDAHSARYCILDFRRQMKAVLVKYTVFSAGRIRVLAKTGPTIWLKLCIRIENHRFSGGRRSFRKIVVTVFELRRFLWFFRRFLFFIKKWVDFSIVGMSLKRCVLVPPTWCWFQIFDIWNSFWVKEVYVPEKRFFSKFSNFESIFNLFIDTILRFWAREIKRKGRLPTILWELKNFVF